MRSCSPLDISYMAWEEGEKASRVIFNPSLSQKEPFSSHNVQPALNGALATPITRWHLGMTTPNKSASLALRKQLCFQLPESPDAPAQAKLNIRAF